MKHTKILLILVAILFNISIYKAHAVEIKTGETIKVTEMQATAVVVTDASGVKFDIRDNAGKVVVQSKTFLDTDNDGSVQVALNISDLKRDEIYFLHGTNYPNKQGDTEVHQQFFTLKNDTVASPKGNWYYTTSFDINAYKTNIDASYFSFTTQAACQVDWQKYLDRIAQEESVTAGAGVQRQFTECFTQATFPTEAEFRAKLKPMSTFNTSSKLYYYLFVGSTATTSIGYQKSEDCKAAENADKARGFRIVVPCKQYDARPDAPAYDTPVIADRHSSPFEETYTLLAPFGGITEVDDAENNAIGKYLNTIFKIAIGIAGALAVIMIVINGIAYMGDDSVFGKTEAKGRIVSAIGGLLLAIGAYAILNTINPDLVGGNLRIAQVNVQISADETSTGSSTSLCISSSSPSPDSAFPSTVTLNSDITGKYVPARDTLSVSTGVKLLITAQTVIEGFYDKTNTRQASKSFRTNNPGNIGNTDDGKTKTFNSLAEGIQAQANIISNIVNNKAKSYKIGGKYTCALGNETYDGSLYQYLRIYSTAARSSNVYLNGIIGYFKANGKTISGRTKMSEIYNMQ